MVRIPRRMIELGASLKEVMSAAEACGREGRNEGQKTQCSPEDFANERGNGPPQEVASFYLDQTEVSLFEYQQCVRARRCAPALPPDRRPLDPLFPVTNLSFFDAQNFCHFRKARLPTEAEYESASRGSNRTLYPWGNFFHSGRANAGRAGLVHTDPVDGFEFWAPTLSFRDGRSPLGVLNLAGNVSEWTASPYIPHDRTPVDVRGRRKYVVKGGDFASSPVHLRATARKGHLPEHRSSTIGFRCASDA